MREKIKSAQIIDFVKALDWLELIKTRGGDHRGARKAVEKAQEVDRYTRRMKI